LQLSQRRGKTHARKNRSETRGLDRRILFCMHFGQLETGPRTSAMIMMADIQTMGKIAGMARAIASR
jgi:hypothetical protein